MDFLSKIDILFSIIFILALLWVVGIGALIIRKNKLNPNHPRTQSVKNSFEPWSGSTSPGVIINSFDSDAKRQLDLTPNINDGFLDRACDDEHHRNSR